MCGRWNHPVQGRMIMRITVPRALALISLLAACTDNSITNISPSPAINCDADNGGITLPSGFCAVVVADLTSNGSPAAARHMTVTPNSDLFVAINSPNNQNPSFGIIGLRDNDG